jgi:hypothetical protein
MRRGLNIEQMRGKNTARSHDMSKTKPRSKKKAVTAAATQEKLGKRRGLTVTSRRKTLLQPMNLSERMDMLRDIDGRSGRVAIGWTCLLHYSCLFWFTVVGSYITFNVVSR